MFSCVPSFLYQLAAKGWFKPRASFTFGNNIRWILPCISASTSARIIFNSTTKRTRRSTTCSSAVTTSATYLCMYRYCATHSRCAKNLKVTRNSPSAWKMSTSGWPHRSKMGAFETNGIFTHLLEESHTFYIMYSWIKCCFILSLRSSSACMPAKTQHAAACYIRL